MTYNLLLWDSLCLKTKTNYVVTFNDSLEKISQTCTIAMQELNGVGLAANQIGFDCSLFVYQDQESEEIITLVNPVITEFDLPKKKIIEACLSIPEYSFEVPRYTKVTVEAQKLDGEALTIEAEGLNAQIFQHEIDHLNGIRILDRLGPAEKKRSIRYLKRK